ncbi:MAG: hypothetical protein NTY34_03630 [Candidatus Omnitrophica bacterium]|nr:hypothetical protein [Candidatus Omnitrophota bacterium]
MENKKRFSWDFFSIVILLFYALIPIVKWHNLPQHMDIYYHLLTSWGFIKAGGYTTWDFWQYAPMGRTHVYPPLAHLIIALFMKAGISGLSMARVLNVIMPVFFAGILWNFIRKNYSSRLAFWVLACASSSFSFYLSSINHLPSTISLIFGIFALDKLLGKKPLQSILLFTLCFYTHIGTSWFFAVSVLLYGLFRKEERISCLIIFLSTIALSIPMLFQQVHALRYISLEGMNERFFREFKTIEYALAVIGLFLIPGKDSKYLLFPAFFIASFLYIGYPARLFSSEGYMPLAVLAAVTLDAVCEKVDRRKPRLNYIPVFLGAFLLVISPTLSFETDELNRPGHKFYIFDSVVMHALFPDNNERAISRSIWFEKYYLPAIEVIKKNCAADEIIYSSIDILGVCLASISGRATANRLLMEVYPSGKDDPIAGARLDIMLKDNTPEWIGKVAEKYNLEKIWENGIFYIYRNRGECPKIKIKKAAVPFSAVAVIALMWLLSFLCLKKK